MYAVVFSNEPLERLIHSAHFCVGELRGAHLPGLRELNRAPDFLHERRIDRARIAF